MKLQTNLFSNEKILPKRKNNKIVILPPLDIFDSIALLKKFNINPTVTILDPWYNKGIGGVREDYVNFVTTILNEISIISDHVFLWGFPETVALFVERIPKSYKLTCWLTWFYKNNPSVIRGWRSSQQSCLHLSRHGVKLYPENFFNEDQQNRFNTNKMRFIPGPSSVLEEPLIVGFVGKNERTGHPSQKPVKLFEKLLKMTTKEGDLVYDPMCGSGTSAEASKNLNLNCIVSDISEEYILQVENRLNNKREKLSNIKKIFSNGTLQNKNKK